MGSFVDKLSLIIQVAVYLPYTIYFNFHYLPWKQAILLPIWLYKPKLRKCKGTVRLNGVLRSGVVKLGFKTVSLYPNNGIMWESEGDVTFNGFVNIGNDSYISTGNNSVLSFGNGFRATCGFKLACYNNIEFGNDVLIGWDCIFTDTDFHSLRTPTGQSKGYGNIKIGSNSWIAMKTICLKNSIISDNCVVAANSLLNHDYSKEGQKLLIMGSPAVVRKHGVYHDRYNDKISYKSDN